MTATIERDGYGGWKRIRGEATGFFHVEWIDGRWWFVTPDGNAFLSAGVSHVDYRGDYAPEFVDFVVGHLKDWGFNTIGWSQEVDAPFRDGVCTHSPGWGPEQYRQAQMPYMHIIRFTDIEWYVDAQFPDVFSEAFEQKCFRLAKEVCPELADDPYLIGYAYSDAPNFALWRQTEGPERFTEIVRRYYEVIEKAIRRYDTHHMLLGDRYKGDRSLQTDSGLQSGVPEDVLDAMRGSIDVLCTEYYRAGDAFEADLAHWHERTGKPIFQADFAFHAPTDVLKVNPLSPSYVPDQAARGEAYVQSCRRFYSNPLVIGAHWCAFGRSVGRKSGLLDGHDMPFEDCVSRMRDFNKNEMYPLAAEAGM